MIEAQWHEQSSARIAAFTSESRKDEARLDKVSLDMASEYARGSEHIVRSDFAGYGMIQSSSH